MGGFGLNDCCVLGVQGVSISGVQVGRPGTQGGVGVFGGSRGGFSNSRDFVSFVEGWLVYHKEFPDLRVWVGLA